MNPCVLPVRSAERPLLLGALVRSSLRIAFCVVSFAGGLIGGPVAASEAQPLSLKAFAAMMADADELVRAQALERGIAAQALRGANALYEPNFFSTIERDGKYLPTTAEDFFRRGAADLSTPFLSYETLIRSGITFKDVLGADYEVSYNLSEVRNSLQEAAGAPSPEFRGTLGFSMSLPLLRGFGPEITKAGISVAQAELAMAGETVRQVLAQRLIEGIQAYVFVQRAEQRVYWRGRALAAAQEIEQEMSRQVAAGLRSSSELTESRANAALRRAQLAQAEQELEEQLNAFQVFFAARERSSPADPLRATRWQPSDPLVLPPDAASGARDLPSLDRVVAQRPEARVNAHRIEREERKLTVVKDQTLPELNFTARYGKESLAATSPSIGRYFDRDLMPYQTWVVGLTFKIGLMGDTKRDSDFRAAQLRKQQAELSLAAVRQRIANELLSAGTVLDRSMQQMQRQADIVSAQRELLAAETQLVKEGRRSRLDVLKRELEVFLAEEALADATAQAVRTDYLTSQVTGRLLARLELE